MNIGVIGTGYVGLVQGVVLSEFGMNVTCMDKDKNKIAKLQDRGMTIYEPGLREMMCKNIDAGRLFFTDDFERVVRESEILFIAVGTPPLESGDADLSGVFAAVEQVAAHMDDYKVVVIKSTVPVGTNRQICERIGQMLLQQRKSIEYDVVSNPEFLREGKALTDCLNPDRIVIGTESERARAALKTVYDVFNLNQTPFVFTTPETAEMIKYASNAFLAVKISFINEMALLAEKTNADVQEIARAMGMDGRISSKFLHAGPGYGGSCFPKDTRAIVDVARKHDEEMLVIRAAIEANEKQKKKMVEKIVRIMGGDLSKKTIAVLGLSFKPETDDMREAPSIDIIRGLSQEGAKIRAYCPEGMPEASRIFEHLEIPVLMTANEYDAAERADAIVLVTEWLQFRSMDLSKVRKYMKDNYFFDLRNVYSKKKELMKAFRYYGVGVR